MSAGFHRPKPESNDDGLSIFGFEDEGWVALMRDASRPEELGRVAGYHVLEEVGRGGQGVVFRARRESGGRVVALKRLAAGSLAGSEARARFQREIEAESVLRHPNIVGFQGVEVVDGQPLLVMEWIDGRPADRWARETGEGGGGPRPIREVLGAFARVCDAVSYAHQRGVIHRDLKPSNILIDAAGEPHVLDFGLARWRSAAERGGGFGPEISRLTRTEGFVGTPAYAAPEQLTGGAQSADVRADVYALGVVLYGMLTGRRPFEESEGDWERLLRAVREEAPSPPSRHDRRVGGEIDAIVLRAMAKDPLRRYQSAHELCADVRRYLAGEPVEARRDSAWYVAQKFLRRHRVGAAAAALVVLSLTGGMAGTTLGLMRAEARRAEAEAAREQTQHVSDFQAATLSGINAEQMGRGIREEFRDQVRASLGRRYVGEGSERRPRTPEEIDAAVAVFDELAGPAPAVDVARGMMDRFVLGRAAGALEKEFADQPLVRAQLHDALGHSYQNLGLYNEADMHYQSALRIRMRELGESHVLVAQSLHDLGHLRIWQYDFTAAEPLLRRALTLRRAHGVDSSEVAQTLRHLARALHDSDPAEAERLHREELALHRRLFGDHHPDVAHSMADLAGVLMDRGDDAGAESLYTGALAIARDAYGESHTFIARLLNDMAIALWHRDSAEAERLLREALAMKRALLGDEHPDVAFTLIDLAILLRERRDYDAAEPLFHEALAMNRRLFGDEDRLVMRCLLNLGQMLTEKGDHAGAEPLIREVVAFRERTVPPDSPDYWSVMNARSILGEAIAGRGAVLAASDPDAAIARLVEAERLLVESGEWLTRHADQIPQQDRAERTRNAVWRLVRLYETWNTVMPGSEKSEQAARWRAELEEPSRP